MYVCKACGVNLPEDASFCPNCGVELNADNRGEAPKALDPVAHPTLSTEAVDELIDGKPADPAPEDKKKAPKKVRSKPQAAHFLLILPVLILVSLVVVVIIAFTTEPKSDVEEKIELFQEGLAPMPFVDANGTVLWGYIDRGGEQVIEPRFEKAKSFGSNGLAAVCIDKKWGYINKNGEIVIVPAFEAADEFGENDYAPVKMNGSWGYINRSGEFVINPQFDEVEPFAENGMALVQIGGKYGYINRKGVYVIEPRYEDARSFGLSGYAAVFVFQKWGMIDKNGNYVINPQFDTMLPFANNDLALVEQDGAYGYVNRKGAYAMRPIYEEAYSFGENGLALVKLDGKYGYINSNCEFVIPPTYDKALPFDSDSGLAAVCEDAGTGLWGYVDYNGDYEIEPTLLAAGSFSKNIAAVRDEEGFFYIKKNGEALLRPEGGCLGIGSFTDDGYAMMALMEGNGDLCYRIINHKGETVIEITKAQALHLEMSTMSP